MSMKTMRLFDADFNAHISAEAYRNLQNEIQADLQASRFMRMIAAEQFDQREAIDQFELEMQEAEQALSVSTEFQLIRLLRVMLVKLVNYFDKIRIDVLNVKKLRQLEDLIKMNMRLYRIKTNGVNFAAYSDMLIVVPNGYSGTSYVKTIRHLQQVVSSLHVAIEAELSKMNNLLSMYIASFGQQTLPSATYDYKKELQTLQKLLDFESKRSLENFKHSTGKNTDKLKNVIAAFGEMEEVYNAAHDLIHFLQTIDVQAINVKTSEVNNNVNVLISKMDMMDEDLYIEAEGKVRELSDVLFTVAKLIELFSSNYYRSVTMIGALDNGLDFLARKL